MAGRICSTDNHLSAIRSPSWSASTKRPTKDRQKIPACARRVARNWSKCNRATRKICRSGNSASICRWEISSAPTNFSISTTTSSGAKVFNDRLPNVVERLLKSGIAEMSEGAVCVFFRDIPELADKPCIVRKRDGGYNYATTDVATVDYRVNDLKADTIWIV